MTCFFFFLFFFFNEKERGYSCHDLLSHTFLCNLIYKLLFKRTLKLYKKNILSLQCVTVNDTGPEKEKKEDFTVNYLQLVTKRPEKPACKHITYHKLTIPPAFFF